MINKQKVKPKRLLSLLLALAMVLGMIPAMSMTAFAYTGTGTEADPYVVTDYAELRNLVVNAPTNGTTRYIKLGADLLSNSNTNANSIKLNQAQSVVLDLAGHSITRSELTTDSSVIEVSSGTLTINDSIGGGEIVADQRGATIVCAVFVLSEKEDNYVTINGGTFIGKDYGIYTWGGTVVINGGTFLATNYYPANFNSGAVTVNGGTFGNSDSEKSSIAISNAEVTLYNCTAYCGMYSGDSSWPSIKEGTTVTINGVESEPKENYLHGNSVVENKGDKIVISTLKPVITTQPSGGHSSTMGDSIVLNIDAENANEYTWHIIDEDGKELTWNYLSNNGYANLQVASGGKMLFLYGVSDWMTGKRVYCEVKGYGGTVMSDIVTLSVDKVIKYCNDLYFEDFDQIWNHKTVGDFKNPKNDADSPYTIGNVRWEMFSKILSDDFEFANGDNVAVRIDVIPKEGYTFYSSVYGKLNGIDSYATIKNEDGSRSIVFNMAITVPDEYKTQDIELSVTEPVAGKTPATTAVCTSGYVVPETPAWTPADETFKTDTVYTVKIPVKAEYAWGDTSTVTAKVNGKDATFIAEYKGGKLFTYYVEYTFDATGSEIEQDYDITVEGGKAYNGSGEEITKCNEGATVTLKANDAPEGMDFDRWEVVSGDITLADETDATTTFVMPANAVSVKAIYNLIPHTHIFDLETIKDEALKTPADCENNAVYYKSCSICEEISDTETFTATDTAKGHSFKNYVSDKNATCTTDGTKTAKCDRCEVTDMVIDTGSAKGHSYSEVWSKDETHHWHECTVCSDKQDFEEHIPNIAEPTETQAKICTVCDYVIADKLTVKNGAVVVDGKTVLYKDGVAVTGTKVVTVDGKTYAVVKGYVVTGKTQIVTIGSKTYIVDKNGVVIKSAKNKLIKVSSSKWYIINKYGIVIKAKSTNKLVNVGKKTYIVNKKGLVQKSAKNKLVKVGKKSYIVDKKGVVLKNKKSVKVGKKTYKVNKKGIATRKK